MTQTDPFYTEEILAMPVPPKCTQLVVGREIGRAHV